MTELQEKAWAVIRCGGSIVRREAVGVQRKNAPKYQHFLYVSQIVATKLHMIAFDFLCSQGCFEELPAEASKEVKISDEKGNPWAYVRPAPVSDLVLVIPQVKYTIADVDKPTVLKFIRAINEFRAKEQARVQAAIAARQAMIDKRDRLYLIKTRKEKRDRRREYNRNYREKHTPVPDAREAFLKILDEVLA